MKKIIYSAALVAIAALAGCGGDRTASVPDKVSATGSIPGDEPIPIIEKLGLPEKCRQPAAFDQECADQIDSAYGKGAGADAKLKLDFCGAYGGCVGMQRNRAYEKSTVPPASVDFIK
ncbi:hypothetical protein [Xanthomonas vasicola]|uniref:hypothetical protein n=1 Tax=Xanthomonas vasicola TaxID=56459 RepID=UPI000F608CD0|nr:hypothetical protein [Xanthomonas vasicola]AZR33099.1 hypothetical protein KWO_022100 [Xanthomonas vasicola pv. musacearum NCPPB 4379]AZR33143.1 hypothetical protein KWO_022360 [Xanthomonas vasicola pv. musacearum NCPPB 4379]MBV7280222.1 hypothetical protein [Xanthomonas vasicola pv. musacearum]MBV7289871.1 hypothetical protein [Xanthomonas vasicola pv. musacearum]RRJ37235.1 hypothetical protein EIM46_17675 [Xanthomonas vasicola pv. musacearum]